MFRLIAATVVLAVIAIIAILVFDREPEKVLPKPEACPVVSNVIDTIVHVFAKDGDVVRLDVRKLTCAQFEQKLRGVSDAATLWTPGEGDWLVIGTKCGCTNTLECVMDAFAAEETAFSLPEIFANCAGTIGEIRPAFEVLDPNDGVVPELFVTKAIPDFGWLACGDLDEDIAKRVHQELRSMQVLRRVVLEGNMLSRSQRETEAVSKWSSAYRLAPNDTLLLERMHHLRKNAEVFFKVGKYAMALKCYETLLGIKPSDYAAAVNAGECLKRLGKKDMSEAVLKKAESLRPKDANPKDL